AFEGLKAATFFVESFFNRDADVAVIAERNKCCRRQGVDRVGTDQRLDVVDVRICGVLCRGRCPKWTLESRSLYLQRGKTFAAEHLLEALVGDLCVCDCDSPLEKSKRLFLFFIAGLCDESFEPFVHRGVDSAHKEACNRSNLDDGFAFGGASLEAA